MLQLWRSPIITDIMSFVYLLFDFFWCLHFNVFCVAGNLLLLSIHGVISVFFFLPHPGCFIYLFFKILSPETITSLRFSSHIIGCCPLSLLELCIKGRNSRGVLKADNSSGVSARPLYFSFSVCWLVVWGVGECVGGRGDWLCLAPRPPSVARPRLFSSPVSACHSHSSFYPPGDPNTSYLDFHPFCSHSSHANRPGAGPWVLAGLL